MPAGMTSGSSGCAAERSRGQVPGGGDAGSRLVAEQRHQVRDAGRPGGGAQVALVRDALVVEGEHVAEVGPPLEDLQAEVAGGRPPGADGLLAGQRPQQGPAETGEVVHPVGDLRRPGGLLTAWGSGGWHCARGRAMRPVAHFDPSTVTCSDPASGRVGSLSTRRIWSAATVSVSGSGAQSGRAPLLRGTGPGTRRRRRGTTGSRRAARWTPAPGRSSSASDRRTRPRHRGASRAAARASTAACHVAGEGGRLAADRDLQIDRDVARGQDVALVAGQPPLVEQLGEGLASWAMVGSSLPAGIGAGERRSASCRSSGTWCPPAAPRAATGPRPRSPPACTTRSGSARNCCGARSRTCARSRRPRRRWRGRGWCRTR